jgi:hypothetical protein
MLMEGELVAKSGVALRTSWPVATGPPCFHHPVAHKTYHGPVAVLSTLELAEMVQAPTNTALERGTLLQRSTRLDSARYAERLHGMSEYLVSAGLVFSVQGES